MANPPRRISTCSWADFDRSDFSCTFRAASIGPALGVNAADQSAVRPISLMTSSRSSPVFALMYCSAASTYPSVASIRVPDGSRRVTSNAPASTSGKNSRRRLGPSRTTTSASSPNAPATTATRALIATPRSRT